MNAGSRRVSLILALAAVVALGAACSPGGPDPLAGREFLSTRVTEAGAERPLVAGTQIRLSFADGQLGADAGCNHLGAAYRLDGDRLVVDSMSTTDMGCDPPRHAQDEWLAELLGSRPAVRVDGDDLVLEIGATSVTLVDRRVADPDLALVGPTWALGTILAGEVASSVPPGVIATLIFEPGGRFRVLTGCNQGGGLVQVGDGTLAFSEIVLTEMGCQGPAGEVETAVLAVLEADVVAFRIEARSLSLDAGGRGLQFSGG